MTHAVHTVTREQGMVVRMLSDTIAVFVTESRDARVVPLAKLALDPEPSKAEGFDPSSYEPFKRLHDSDAVERGRWTTARRATLQDESEWQPCDELKQAPLTVGLMGDPWFYGYSPDREAPAEDLTFEEEIFFSMDRFWKLEEQEGISVPRMTVADDEATVAWVSRDQADDDRAAKRRAVEGRKAPGTEYPVGWQGEYEWLCETLQQLRVEYRELLMEAIRKRRVNVARAREFAQLQAVQRRAESLKARYNVRRYIEALGGDPESYQRRGTWIEEEKLLAATIAELDGNYYRDGVAAEGLLAR